MGATIPEQRRCAPGLIIKSGPACAAACAGRDDAANYTLQDVMRDPPIIQRATAQGARR